MQKAAQKLSSMLAMLALMCVSLVSFTACSDDDEPVEEVTYSWEFEEVEASTPDFMDDKNIIESTFKTALGASGSATSVTKRGTPETCDQEVLEACRQALESLKDEAWQGHYTFTVTNEPTGTVIFSHAFFNVDNENSGTYMVKIGDYYYSDGTWSDGGLRVINGDGSVVWADPAPKPDDGKTVIGIVFYVGHHPKDNSDYSESGIGQAKCHGYVVALTDVNKTDVNNGVDERICWEFGPGNISDKEVGASALHNEWQGYYDNQKIHEFVNKNKGWEMKHFPAAFACEAYGNPVDDRKVNLTDTYDWHKPLSAPKNTSGWFLPSCGQLMFLYQNRSHLAARMADVRNSTPTDCSYKDYIKWLQTLHYWSSTECIGVSSRAWGVSFYNGFTNGNEKRLTHGVRAVLAF